METVLIIFSAILPAICLFLLVYFLDKYKKEPLKLLLKGFAYGAILAVLIVWVYGWLLYMVYSPASTIMGATMDAFISAAIPEELAKFFLLWLLLRKNKHYDEYIDGIVYAACIGLGFAATENIGYLIDAYHNGEFVQVGIIRALFTVPGHLIDAVVMGYFYAKATFDDPSRRKKNLALAICIPILLHGIWDAICMVSDEINLNMLLFLLVFVPLFKYYILQSIRLWEGHLTRDKQIMVSNVTTISEDNIQDDDSLKQA